jgi:hypothetical protein
MNSFNWKKALGAGLLIGAISSVWVIIMFILGFDDSWFVRFSTLAVAGLVTFFFARQLPMSTVLYAMGYGLLWATITALLDAVVMPKANTWLLWPKYSVILIVTLFWRLKFHMRELNAKQASRLD